jgi:hypothetical protein
MQSPISEDCESHKQQAGGNDANAERQVGSPRDAPRFPAIHQTASFTARMTKRPVCPRLSSVFLIPIP